MFTIFDFIKLIGAVVGAIVGGCYGYQVFGWLAAIIGVPLGFVVGMFIGNLPWAASSAWMRFNLKRCNTEKLKERLQHEYFVSHLLIAELVSRGEPLEQFRGYVTSLLHSNSSAERQFGEGTARIWFPELLSNTSPPSSALRTQPTINERNDT